MRKYVVPIVALAGIALLSPHANAAEMIIKSRAVPPGKTGSLPVSVINVSANQLWGVDLAVTFSNAAVSAGTFASTGAAFEPRLAGATGATPTDVVVSGTSFVGTTKPSMYWGYVRGAAGMETDKNTSGTPSKSLGLMKVQVAAGTALKTIVNLNTANYDVKNDGTGNDVSRPAATGATSTGTVGAAVANETVSVLDIFPGYAAPAAGAPDYRVPLHKVAVGAPGDVTGDGVINNGDATLLGRVALGITSALPRLDDYLRISGDVAPGNTYVPGSSTGAGAQGSGNFGGSYGDGLITSGDATLTGRFALGIASAVAAFPTPES